MTRGRAAKQDWLQMESRRSTISKERIRRVLPEVMAYMGRMQCVQVVELRKKRFEEEETQAWVI